MSAFVDMPLHKLHWSPSPLPSQVLLITTLDDQGRVGIAPKSCGVMASFSGPTFGFGCNRAHATCRNIEARREFVVNVPGEEMAPAIWRMPEQGHGERLRSSGLTVEEGVTVGVPHLRECTAHLECRLDRILDIKAGEILILGTVTRVAVDERCTAGGLSERYAALRTPLFYLQEGHYAPMGPPRSALDAEPALPGPGG